MNQDLSQELLAVMPETTSPQLGLFEAATCTIKARSNTVSGLGQVNMQNYTPIVGLENIPCMFAIQRPALPNVTATVRTATQFDTQTQFHVLLNAYYPAIEQQNLANVNGQDYEIMAVESDSQQQMTRLACRIWTL